MDKRKTYLPKFLSSSDFRNVEMFKELKSLALQNTRGHIVYET